MDAKADGVRAAGDLHHRGHGRVAGGGVRPRRVIPHDEVVTFGAGTAWSTTVVAATTAYISARASR